jgi:hypothetical protein
MQDTAAEGTSSRPEPAAAAAAAAAAVEPAATPAAAPVAAADGAAIAAAASSSSGVEGLSVLTNTEPIDRLRYQALLMFSHWDSSNSGRLTGEQLGQFFTWCTRKVGIYVWLIIAVVFAGACKTCASAVKGRQHARLAALTKGLYPTGAGMVDLFNC